MYHVLGLQCYHPFLLVEYKRLNHHKVCIHTHTKIMGFSRLKNSLHSLKKKNVITLFVNGAHVLMIDIYRYNNSTWASLSGVSVLAM